MNNIWKSYNSFIDGAQKKGAFLEGENIEHENNIKNKLFSKDCTESFWIQREMSWQKSMVDSDHKKGHIISFKKSLKFVQNFKF